MQKPAYVILFLLILWYQHSNAERAMYVDGFQTILGDVTAENNLLSFAQARGIETLLLYGLHVVHANHDLTNPATNSIMADFISKAKTTYGILYMGATAENGSFFTHVIDTYNNSRSTGLEKFDIYNLEFEFWVGASTDPGGYYCTTYLTPNGLPCSNTGAFRFFIATLKTMDTLAANNTHSITTEAYVGWPTAGQADTIGDHLDKLRLHAYVSNPNTSFDYADDRLIDFANGTPGLDVSIIFSSEPAFMQTWLENNSMVAAEDTFTNDYNTGSAAWINDFTLDGFTYFAYSFMTSVPLPIELTYFNGQLTDHGIQLDWETLSESNTDYFEVERQATLKGEFTGLSTIPAAGNSTSAIQYRFLDANPYPGTNYYRLKQVDLDGGVTHSKIIAIANPIMDNAVNIYPSLAQDILYIAASGKINHVLIYDVSGQKIKEINDFDPNADLQINIGDLNQGTYLLILRSDSKIESFRFNKLR